MNEQEQRIAIAEACPNILCHSYTHGHPLQCLNAMHEAEKLLKGIQVEIYESYLERFTEEFEGYVWHATADQRAEAFLRTIGKWEK